jgi:hypothetical protein
MKKLVLCLMAWLSLSITFAQVVTEETVIVFEENKFSLTEDVKDQIDKAYDLLKKGNTLQMHLLSKSEKKKPDAYKLVITPRRASVVNHYLILKRLKLNNISFNIERIGEKKKVFAGSNADYRDFTKQQGIISVIVHRPADEGVPYAGTDSLALKIKKPECITFDASKKQVLYFGGGTKLEVPANAFVFKNGAELTSKTITLCIYSFLYISDMISVGLTTHSNREMLEAAGMFFIEATCDNKKLKIKSGISLDLTIIAEKTKSGMKVFEGGLHDNLLNWKEDKDGVVLKKDVNSEVEGGGEPGYILKISNLGWINCDRFIDDTPKTDLLVKFDTAYKPSVIMVFKNYKSILPAYYYSADKKVKFRDIPKNEPVVVIVYNLTADPNKIVYGFKSLVTGKSEKEEIELKESTTTSFDTFLKSLE